MYLRITQRRNRDGSTVAYYALAENAWNAVAKRSEARIVHNFGRADQMDREGLKRLVDSINRVLDQGDAVTRGVLRSRHVFGREPGDTLARARPLHPGCADAQGEGDRDEVLTRPGPLQAGGRQSPGQGGRGRRGRA